MDLQPDRNREQVEIQPQLTGVAPDPNNPHVGRKYEDRLTSPFHKAAENQSQHGSMNSGDGQPRRISRPIDVRVRHIQAGHSRDHR